MYAIQSKVYKMGLATDWSWTEEEIQIMKDYYETSTVPEMLEKLPNRTHDGIVKKAMALTTDKKIKPEDMTLEKFSSLLYTADIPDPDILIRTSGEQRISNYLLWQLAYTELFFTETLWPDFSKTELSDIIEQFSNRERRYGKS
jgi:hypothetical protein